MKLARRVKALARGIGERAARVPPFDPGWSVVLPAAPMRPAGRVSF